MRARVRKSSGGDVPAAPTADNRRGDGTAKGASGSSSERRAGTEVGKRNEGRGGNLPPWPALVAATIPTGRPVTSPLADDDPRAIYKSMFEDGIIVLDTPSGELVPERGLLLARGDLLIGCDDTPVHRSALLADGLNVFKVAGAPDRLFGATYDLEDKEWLTRLEPEPSALDIERQVQLLKYAAEAERIVYGVVLEPNSVDAQDDTISPEEIRSAAHSFMQDYGNVGLQHQTFINGKARILESFIAPADMQIGDQEVRKGTWLMAMRVLDDDIWDAVEKGVITGFSIGGSALRKPVAFA